jgi:AAA ATPase domain
MNRRDNPYTPGAGRKPAVLAGRDDDLDDFRLLIDRLQDGLPERSMVFSGLRGVGKTVLLLEFDVIAREAGWASTDVQEVGLQNDFRVSFARLGLRVLRSMSLKARMRDRARRALGVVKAFSASVPGGVKLQLDVEAAVGSADSGDLEEDLTDLLMEIGAVGEAGGSGALFLIDEMQNLDDPSLGAICMAFHRLSQKNLPVALVAAGLPTLRPALHRAKPYASRLFAYRDVGRLSAAAARSALIAPAARLEVRFTDGAADMVIEESGGYPYYLQEYGRVVWDEVEGSPIRLTDIERVHDIVQDSLDSSFFGPQFDLATDAEQRYLLAIAALGDGPYSSAEAAAAAGYASVSGASFVREGLIAKELIWSPRRGVIDFTVPRFAQHLRATHVS